MFLVSRITRKPAGSIFYGWWIVFAGFFIQILNGGLLFHGFTVYFIPLQEEFGWSRALVAAGFALTRFESAILGPIQGWAIDRFGPRLITVIGMVIFGAGFIVFAATNSVLFYFGAFLLLALGSSLGGFLAISASITNWFAKNRAKAMGISMTGMGIGGLLVPALAYSVTTFGWRPTAVASGLLVWLIGIPTGWMLRHKPEPYGYLPDGVRALDHGDDSEETVGSVQTITYEEEDDFTVREALKTPAFWLISGGHAAALLVVASVSIHQIPHMVHRLGMSLEGAATVVAILMGMTMIGQVGGGFLGDRVSKRVLLVTCLLGHMTGLLVFAYATSYAHLVLFAMLHGIAWGARGPVMQSLRAEFFGRASFATIMGFSSMFVMIAMMVAPVFAGWLADLRDGDYTLPFTILALTAGSGSIFFWFAKKPEHKRKDLEVPPLVIG